MPLPVKAIAVLLLIALTGGTAEARARWPRLHLEHLDQTLCSMEQQVTAHVAYLELQGTLKEASPEAFRMELDGKELKIAPLKTSTFSGSGLAMQLVLVVQASAPYAAALPHVRNGARALLRALPDKSLVTIIAYDSQVRPIANGVSAKEALEAVAQLKEGSAERDLPALVPALEMGLRRLSLKAKPARRLLVVISDGLNLSLRKKVFRDVGDLAFKEGIPIFPVGFSPADERGPLLNLGELAKRSIGMFRWARSTDQIVAQLESVALGITEQLLLTFAMADACQKPHEVRLALGGQRSNARKMKVSKAPPTGWLGTKLKLRKELGPRWALVLSVGAGALLILLFGVPLAIVLAVRRARRREEAAPQAPAVQEAKPRTEPEHAPLPDPRPRQRTQSNRQRAVTMASQIEQPSVEAPLTQTRPPLSTQTSGEVTPPPAPLPAPPPVQPAPAQAFLILEGPPRPGMRLEVSPGIWRLGSAADCLPLYVGRDQGVSTYHAELRFTGPRLSVRDLESRAGTRINGHPIQEAELNDGDVLELGQARLRVRRV